MTYSEKTVPAKYAPLSSMPASMQAELAQFMETFKGRVLDLIASNGDVAYFDDYRVFSNLRAIVWNPVTGQAEQRIVLSLDGQYSSVASPIVVDATPEYQAAYAKWYAETYLPPIVAAKAKADVESEVRKVSDRIASIEDEIQRGSIVTVVRGRKYAHGLTGKAFWIGQDKFGGTKVGVAMSDRRDSSGRNEDVMWIAMSNLSKVLSPEEQGEVNALGARINGIKATEAERAARYTAQYAVPGSHQNYALAAM